MSGKVPWREDSCRAPWEERESGAARLGCQIVALQPTAVRTQGRGLSFTHRTLWWEHHCQTLPSPELA